MSRLESFTSLGSPRAELEKAWRERLADAEVLLNGERFEAAITAAIYALEIRLKVLICDRLQLDQLPKVFEFHYLNGLLYMAGLHRKLQAEGESAVRKNWDAVVDVSKTLNDLRYQPGGRYSTIESSQVLARIRTPPDGVIPWLETTSS